MKVPGTKNASGKKRLKGGGDKIKPEFGSKRGAAGVGVRTTCIAGGGGGGG